MPSKPAPVMPHLNLWWVLAAGIVVGLGFVATHHMWRAWGSFALTLGGCALLRLTLPDPLCGGLVVRRKWVDVTTLAVLAVAVAVVGRSLELSPVVPPR